jgi:hypothetical protein
MAVEFICDGCGKREMGPNGFRPPAWFVRGEETKNDQGRTVRSEFHVCSRRCIDRYNAKTGKRTLVLPV